MALQDPGGLAHPRPPCRDVILCALLPAPPALCRSDCLDRTADTHQVRTASAELHHCHLALCSHHFPAEGKLPPKVLLL